MISDNVKAIGANAFDNCSELSEIKLPASLNVICDEMFSGCTSLTSVVIPDSVTAIHKGAFSAVQISRKFLTRVRPAGVII